MSVTAAQLAASSIAESAKDQSDLCFEAFALSDCTVETDPQAARYLRAVHRIALEVAVPNYFGATVGGFWLLLEQIDQLRSFPDFYPANEAPHVARAVEAFLTSQLQSLNARLLSKNGISTIG